MAGAKTGMIWEILRLVWDTNAAAEKRKAKGRKGKDRHGFVDLIVLENVTGLLNRQDVGSGRGAGVVAILTALEAHGYSVAEEVVAAKAVGSTQQRNRVFIVATRVGSGLPLAADLLLPRGRPCRGECSAGSGPCWACLEETLAGLRAKVGAGRAASKWMEGHSLCISTSDGGQEHTPRLDDIATLTERNGEGMLMLVPGRDELTGFLTVEIAERTVGFPVGWTAVGQQDKTMRWSVLGNAVDVEVARMLAALLHPARHAAAHGAYERGEDTSVMVQGLHGETVMMGSGRSLRPFPSRAAVWSDADGKGFFKSPSRDKYPVHVRAVPLVQALDRARRAGHHVRCAATTPENRDELSRAIKIYRSKAKLNNVGKKLLDGVLASFTWYTPS